MTKLRMFSQFEALAKMALVNERIMGMRSSYRAEDLIPALDSVMGELDRIEAAISATRKVEGN